MKNIFLEPLRICLWLAFIPLHSFAYQEITDSYRPLSKAEMTRQFPLKYEGTFHPSGNLDPDEKLKQHLLPENINIGISGVKIKMIEGEEDRELSITGKDQNNRGWNVSLGGAPLNHGFRFYSADLDKNGIRDGLFTTITMGNGLAPTRHLFTLTFDETGRPILFEIEGFFQERNNDIFDVVDLDRNGQAEIIYMNFSAGYWATNIYEIHHARWKRVVGKHAERSYPLYTRFTSRPNRVPVAPKAGKQPVSDDLSNDVPKNAGALESYRWANINSSEDILLNLKTDSGKKIECSPASWYSTFTLAIDKAEGRRIVSLGAPERIVKAALDEIVSNKYRVKIFGQRGNEKDSPEMLWATEK